MPNPIYQAAVQILAIRLLQPLPEYRDAEGNPITVYQWARGHAEEAAKLFPTLSKKGAGGRPPIDHESRVLAYFRANPTLLATREEVSKLVGGNRAKVWAAIASLIERGNLLQFKVDDRRSLVVKLAPTE